MKYIVRILFLVAIGVLALSCSKVGKPKGEVSGHDYPRREPKPDLSGDPAPLLGRWTSEMCDVVRNSIPSEDPCTLKLEFSELSTGNWSVTLSDFNRTSNFTIVFSGNEITEGSTGALGKIGGKGIQFEYNLNPDHPRRWFFSMMMDSANRATVYWRDAVVNGDKVVATAEFSAIVRK